MCGINLTIHPGLISAKEMNDSIAHRGIHGISDVMDYRKDFQLGHVRLPIIGLDDAFNQPYDTDNWTFVFNGEIFNYKEFNCPWLRKDDELKSDVQVVGDFLEGMGDSPDARDWHQMKKFDGFWSIIAYHRETDLIYVVTDFLAKKPLYIHAPTLTVSSEMKAFQKFPKSFNRQYFAAVGKWGYCPKDQTPFNEVQKLPRGCVTVINPKEKKIVDTFRYLDVVPDESINLRDALETAVKNRLVSDVPVSLLLSGGVDSSIIYKLMEQHTHDFTIFHIENDESKYLDYLDIPDDIEIKMLDLIEDQDLTEVLFANEGPVDLGSMLPQFRMSQAIAKAGLKVCITGDGADEVFGGYRRQAQYDAQYSDIFDELVHYHLPRLDKMSMYFTTELRSPFLSLPVIQAGLAMNYERRIDKNGLKDYFSDLVPDEILYRKKHPLKSDKVLSGLHWRYELIEKFKEMQHNG